MQPGGEGRRGPIPVPMALRAALGIEPTPHLSLELLKSFRGRQFVVQPSEKAGLRHATRPRLVLSQADAPPFARMAQV